MRGFYFTSGLQEGKPLDRVVGAMGRAFGLRGGAGGGGGARRSESKSFFLRDVFMNIVFPDADSGDAQRGGDPPHPPAAPRGRGGGDVLRARLRHPVDRLVRQQPPPGLQDRLHRQGREQRRLEQPRHPPARQGRASSTRCATTSSTSTRARSTSPSGATASPCTRATGSTRRPGTSTSPACARASSCRPRRRSRTSSGGPRAPSTSTTTTTSRRTCSSTTRSAPRPPPGQRRVGEGPARPGLGRAPAALQRPTSRSRTSRPSSSTTSRSTSICSRTCEAPGEELNQSLIETVRDKLTRVGPARRYYDMFVTVLIDQRYDELGPATPENLKYPPITLAEHLRRSARGARQGEERAARCARASGPRCRGPTPTRATSRCSPRSRTARSSSIARSGSCP